MAGNNTDTEILVNEDEPNKVPLTLEPSSPPPVTTSNQTPQNSTNSHTTNGASDPVMTYLTYVKLLILLTAFTLYHIFLGFAIYCDWPRCVDWCHGSKFLLILTIIAYTFIGYSMFVKFLWRKHLKLSWENFSSRLTAIPLLCKIMKWGVRLLFVAGVVVFYIYDSWNKWYKLIPLAGIAFLILLGYIFSNNRQKINWRHVVWGLSIQFCMGLITIRWPLGRQIFQCISDKVVTFLSYGNTGAAFVFDYLTTGNLTIFINNTLTTDNLTIFNNHSHEETKYEMITPIFGFQVLPVILFFGLFINILYYYGIMQCVVEQFGRLLRISIGTTHVESLNAAASVFVGMTEAPLMIKPYMKDLTKSELHAVMAGGFATIAGTVFAAYISFGINGVYLISGATMSAPAALAYSKLLYPETQESEFKKDFNFKFEARTERNVLEAAAKGAMDCVKFVTGIAVSLIVFIALINFVDGILIWLGSMVYLDFVTLEWLFGKIFTPLAYLMGVKWDECGEVGTLIGIKTVINEFVAYKKLSTMTGLSPRSTAIATYALCSFSNFSSLGMQIGSLGALEPTKKAEFAEVGFRALCAGAAACFLTTCFAGSLID